jgi:hypothetical protein
MWSQKKKKAGSPGAGGGEGLETKDISSMRPDADAAMSEIDKAIASSDEAERERKLELARKAEREREHARERERVEQQRQQEQNKRKSCCFGSCC